MRIRLCLLPALLLLALVPPAAGQEGETEVGKPVCFYKAFAPTTVKNGIVGRGRARLCTAPVTVRVRVCLQEREVGERYRTLTCTGRKRFMQNEDVLRLRTRARGCKSRARYRSVVRGRVGSAKPTVRRSRSRMFCAVGDPPPPPSY